jgi:hypothetical protein
VGPQSTITCPAGALDIFPGINIQKPSQLLFGNTTFCLRAGIHHLTSAITPKSGDVFVGRVTARSWTARAGRRPTRTKARSAPTIENIDDVTIRNLVIRDMPQKGIHAYRDYSDRWTIEYNDISGAVYGRRAAE